MWRWIAMAALVIGAVSDAETPPASQPSTTQNVEEEFEQRLWAVERDLAAVIHLITTGEVKTPVPQAGRIRGAAADSGIDELRQRVDALERALRGADRDGPAPSPMGSRPDTDALEQRVEHLERLVGGPDRDLATQSPTGLRTDADAFDRRIDQLERLVRDQERTIQSLERRIDRLGRP